VQRYPAHGSAETPNDSASGRPDIGFGSLGVIHGISVARWTDGKRHDGKWDFVVEKSIDRLSNVDRWKQSRDSIPDL